MNLLLVLCDTLAIAIPMSLCIVLRLVFGGSFSLGFYMEMSPVTLLFPLFYAFAGLYPSILVARHEELKRQTLATCLVFLSLLSMTFFMRTADDFSRLAIIGGWFLSLGTVPFARSFVRARLSEKDWWGVPAVLYGPRSMVDDIAAFYDKELGLGIRVKHIIASDEVDDDAARNALAYTAQMRPMPIVLCALEPHHLEDTSRIHWLENHFRRILFLPPAFLKTLNLTVHDIGGTQFLQSHTKWHDPVRQRIKRAMDLICIILSLPVLIPLFALIALAIFIEDRHAPFFRQERIGHGGQPFRIWKFRTMVPNADAVLRDHLAANPAIAREWAETQKLKNDPRVTRVGAFLRKTSLDELPQLINVALGEMSLVGPRPIVESEIERYQEAFDLYTRTMPGLTGLWQVSGRSNTSYAERIRLDMYYTRSWSVWMDIHILTRTFRVVLDGDGAY